MKYDGLNGTEIALSESQERMAIVVEAKDVENFKPCKEENLDATVVAEVTSDDKMTIVWKGNKIVELERSFWIPMALEKSYSPSCRFRICKSIRKQRIFKRKFHRIDERFESCFTKGLNELFDDSIGRGTVLKPFGGRTQNSPEDVSVQKFPTDGFTNSVSMASFEFDPRISRWSPYHGAYFAVMESVAKIVAAGGDYSEVRLTFQEYFESLRDDQNVGKTFGSIVGLN